MTKEPLPGENKKFTTKVIEATVRLTILILLIGWCFAILQPFALIFAWSIIMAIAVFPLYDMLKKKLKGRKKLASIIVTFFFLAIIIIPSGFITKSMVKNIKLAKELVVNDKLKIPPPDESVKDWPVIGKSTYNFWYDVSLHLDEQIVKYSDQLKEAGLWLLENISGAGLSLLQFILSIIISGILLFYSESGRKTIDEIGVRLIGEKGKEFVNDSIVTVRNVARGILGVAFMQAVLFGLGLVIAGVPFAGIWTVICLILAIIQLGLIPIILPISIYIFMTGDLLTAILLTIWMIFISLIDNIVKPLIMGRNAPAPTLVIFLGAIGGFMLNGIIGLFIGAVVLSLGYKIFHWWLKMEHISPLS